ncbi:Pentatricopeptide repeat-containing protein [Rhynchospora pubera]|uniref:Pentatricopeptide repeat-containing protein n=1 Tax=Rhynchospora pubera TaxID=906938 RepID=A0AAV8F3I1_9POAL|nr:Pentatricopeptide repeat-containing protein [Rhynchospora pubera]
MAESWFVSQCSSVASLMQLHARHIVMPSTSSTNPHQHLYHLLSKLLSLPLSSSSSSSASAYASSLISFSSQTNPPPPLHNLLIRDLATSQRSPLLALRLFLLLLHGPSPGPDSHTFPFVFLACADLPALRFGQSTHSLAIKNGLLSHLHIANSLITMYSRCSQLASARQVFDEIPLKDLVSWNSIISGYVKMGFPSEALGLFRQMLSDGWDPNDVTVLGALAACSKLGDLKMGKWLHSYVQAAKLNTASFVGSALIVMYAKCGFLEEARRVFDGIKRKDPYIWNSMITGYAQNGMSNKAIALFHSMKESNVKPDKITLVGVLSACASVGALDLGKQLDEYAFNKGLHTNVFVGTALIDMYGKCGYLDGAIQVFDKMPHKNGATWNAFISALALIGRGKHAISMFHKMIKQGICPDDITFIGVLSACVHAGLVKEGHEWFDRMQVEFHINPQKEHYSCMVDLLARAGHLEEAWSLVEQMGDKADAVVLGALLAACRKYRCLQVGDKVIEKLLEIEPTNSLNYVLSSRIYEKSNRLDDSARMRGLMRERGVIKTPGCSWIEICGEVHEFYARDELHYRVGDIYQMIDLLVWEMRLEGYVPNTEL